MAKCIDSTGQPLPQDAWAGLDRVTLAELLESPRPQAILRCQPADDLRPQPADLWQHCAGIEIEFPKFMDGRGFSQARLLRENGYSGPLRAVGDVLVDQLFYMRRCGFDQFELDETVRPEAIAAVLGQFAVIAQPSWNDQGLRRRKGAPAAA